MARPVSGLGGWIQGILLSVRYERVVTVCAADTLVRNRVGFYPDNLKALILKRVEDFVYLLVVFLVSAEYPSAKGLTERPNEHDVNVPVGRWNRGDRLFDFLPCHFFTLVLEDSHF